MARISKPSESSIRVGGRVSSAPANPQLGQMAQALGAQMAQGGDEYFQKAHSAFQTAQYSKAMKEATLAFNETYGQRVSQQVDKDGNPTFNTLVDDTGNLGKQALENSLKNVTDYQVRQRMASDFGKYVTNRQLSAQSEARKQHLSYTRTNIMDGIDALKQQAMQDESINAGQYLGNINSIVETGLESGALSPAEASNLRKVTGEQVRGFHISKMIEQSPDEALDTLEGSTASELGISPQAREKAIYQARKNIDQIAREEEKQNLEQQRVAKEAQNLRTDELDLGITKGTIGEQDIEREFGDNKISQRQRIGLLKKVVKRDMAAYRKGRVDNMVNTRLENNLPMTDLSPSDINNHYETRVTGISQQGPNGQPMAPPSLREKAKLAKDYTAPVTAFAKEVNHGILSGNTEKAIEALDALEFVQNSQPLAVETNVLNTKARAVAATYKSLVNNTSVSPEDALKSARKAVLEKDDVITQQRSTDYRKIKAFKPEKIKDTVLDMFDPGIFSFEPDAVSPGLENTFSRLFKAAYLETGDEDAAIEMVKKQTSALYGVSEFNGEDTVMLLPPEKAFPGADPAILKRDLETSLEDLQLPQGVAAGDVKISSDDLTRANPGQITYGLYYTDQYGNSKPVEDENGIPVRWTPDYKKALEDSVEGTLEKKRAVKEALQQNRLNNLTRMERILTKVEEASALMDPEDKHDHEYIGPKPDPVTLESFTIKGGIESANKGIEKLKEVIKVTPEQKKMMFDTYRKFFGKLKTSQVEGLETLASKLHGDDSLTLEQKAYIMATVKHETANTFQPIAEFGKGRGRSYGRPDPETGQTYYGRGYVQLTHRENYKRMGDLLGVDLVNNPELAQDPDIAYQILVIGMKEGLFTGVGLDKYINEGGANFQQARRIVNGTDRASKIANEAKKMVAVLKV